MSVYLARVYVTLKLTVNDPQGLTIRGGLHSLGFAEVESVRAGKYMEIRFQANDRAQAEKQVAENALLENCTLNAGVIQALIQQ